MSNLADNVTVSLFSQLLSLLQLKYQTQTTPFTTLPTTMLFVVSTIMLYYLLYIVLKQFPSSRFAAVAKHFMVWSASAAVSTLLAALFPGPARPIIYTFSGLLSAGQVLYAFRNQLPRFWSMQDEDEDENDEDEGEASKFEVCTRKVGRFLKNICSGVAEFFRPLPTLPT